MFIVDFDGNKMHFFGLNAACFLSAFQLVVLCPCHFVGFVKGNKISKPMYGYIATALAVVKGILIVCILAFVVDLEIHEGRWFEFFVVWCLSTLQMCVMIKAVTC